MPAVDKADLPTPRHLHSPAWSTTPCRDRSGRTVAAGSGIDRPLIPHMGRHRSRLNILARAETGVDPPLFDQLFQYGSVSPGPRALEIGSVGSPFLGPLIPSKPKPSQILESGLNEVRCTPNRVKVLHSKYQNSIPRSDPFLSLPKRRTMTHVEITRGSRGNAPAIALGRLACHGVHFNEGSLLGEVAPVARQPMPTPRVDVVNPSGWMDHERQRQPWTVVGPAVAG